MSSELDQNIVLHVENVKKIYPLFKSPLHVLKHAFKPRKNHIYYKSNSYTALNNVSFSVKKGETIGIIGRNGSGKSTLLQIICGTLQPTNGSVSVKGKVAALLELGSGFNPEYTGIENVYLNGSILGLSKKEIDFRLHEILTFADIGDFIHQPVKTYSSGMLVRLAFSVIIHTSPDILIIDEALAVGDTFFQQKCIRKLNEFKSNGGTILFVSHDTATVVSLCQKALLLTSDKSSAPTFGEAKEICKKYLEDIYNDESRRNAVELNNEHPFQNLVTERPEENYHGEDISESYFKVSPFRKNADSFGTQKGRIVNSYITNEFGEKINSFKSGDRIKLIIEIVVFDRILKPAFGFMFKNAHGEYLYTEGTDYHFRNQNLSLNNGDKATVAFLFNAPLVIHGEYTINIAFADGEGDNHLQLHWIHDAFKVDCYKSRLVHGYSGTDGLSIEIKVSRNAT